MSRFLKFVVEETLNGRLIKGTSSLSRSSTKGRLRSQTDSTVRTGGKANFGPASAVITRRQGERTQWLSRFRQHLAASFDDRRNGNASSPQRPWWRGAAAGAVGLAVVALGAGLFWRPLRPAAPEPRTVPLTSYPDLEEHPSLSPDGAQVAFHWKGDIYVKQVEGEGLAQVTRDPAVEDWPSWSPDGSQIAFVRNGAVFLVPALGGSERRVAESTGRAVWLQDGSALLVTARTSPYAKSIFLVSLTGEAA
jgi:Tol biopolymer transport system component